MRVSALPLAWRLRLAIWLPAGAGVLLAALLGPWPPALGAGAALAVLIQLLAEPLLRELPTAARGPTADIQPAPWAEPEPEAPAALACALEQGALTVLYRPLRTLPGLALCGVEAEPRWRHPLAGLLPPADWPQPLPPDLAERLLDRWLVEACTCFARWAPQLEEGGAPAQLWLPLPPAWLEVPALHEALERAVSVAGLAPERLRLRCSPVLQGRTAVLPAPLAALPARGYGLAADALGTGSASLAHLTELPLRAVCLDRSFVERAGQSAPQRLVVESTARLAASLGMQTLADGVVGEEQARSLGALGCQLALGEACGPWLDADDWARHWSQPRFADTGADALS